LPNDRDDSERFYLGFWGEDDRRMSRICWMKFHVLGEESQILTAWGVAFPVRQNEIPVSGGHRSINSEDVTVTNAGKHHGFTTGTIEKSRGCVSNQQPVEVNPVLFMVFGGAGKP